MSMTVGELVAYLTIDDKDFNRKLDEGERKFSKFGSILKGGALAGGVAALAGLTAVIHSGIGETLDASAGHAQLVAGIKSTGGAAGVTAKGIEALAGKIQGYSGQTDDSIVATSKLLLTFTNIKNSGPNKIFDQATIAAADMAAKMGGDASGAAIQLGKALNDPVKGVTALARVGVSFTDAQKASIKAMVESGDTMGAQKLILSELNKEFGGAAKAAGDSLPGQLERGKRAFEDMSQSVVTSFVPIVVPAIVAVANGLKRAVPYITSFAQGFANLLQGGEGESFAERLNRMGASIGTLAKRFVEWIAPMIPGFLVELGKWLVAVQVWMYTVALPAIVVQLVEWGKALVEWIGPRIGPMLTELGILLERLKVWTETVARPAIVAKLKEWGKAFAAWVPGAVVSLLLELAKLQVKLVAWIVGAALRAIVAAVGRIWTAVAGAAKTAWNVGIVGAVSAGMNAIERAIDNAKAKVKSAVGAIWTAIKDAAKTAWGATGITGVVSGAWTKITGYIGKVTGAIDWVIKQLNKLAGTSIGTIGSVPSGSRESNGGTGGAAPRSVGDLGSSAGIAGVPHAPGQGGMGGGSGASLSGIVDWVKDLWDKWGIGGKLPSSVGGLFGNASGLIGGMAKEAIIDLLKKHGGGPGQSIVDWAKTQIGKPYLWGATGPDAYDCSGLIYRAYATMGKPFPTRANWWNYGRLVSGNQVRPADVGFFNPDNSQGVKYGHVKMYAGNGQAIESASGGVHMSPWGGASEIRTYLAKGGVIIGGESGAEAVLPLTDAAAMAKIRAGLGGGPSIDARKFYITVQAPPSGRVDVKRLWADIQQIESKAATAARRGSVRG